jgi:O-Antigen ligase
VTLLLTFSRGAIVAAGIALLGYLAIVRQRGAAFGLLAIAPPTAIGVVAAYRSELLASEDFAGPAGLAQGHDLALVVTLCMVAAGAARALLLAVEVGLERAIDRGGWPRGSSARWLSLAGASSLAVAGIVLALFLDVPDRVERQYALFVAGPPSVTDTRDRLTSASNNGRLEQWSVALDAFRAAPLTGHGAGTFQVLWTGARATDLYVVDGHSLYLESLAELGVVGLALLGAAQATLLGALLIRARGPDRGPHGVLAAAVLAWVVHTGVDWHWELPAVTAWVFALGGLAIAAPRAPAAGRLFAPLTRIVAAIGCLVLAVTPGLVALSQQTLDDSTSAFRRGDCRRTADAALSSISLLSVRPQPFELLAYCDMRAGLSRLAVKSMEKALARDPANWEYHYGLALVRGASGLDPRPQAATALAHNPRSRLVQAAAIDLGTADRPREWRSRALRARLPIAR